MGNAALPARLLAELFDGVVISGEVGIRKPAPEIYALGAERIGLEPGACVFVDDLPFNLEPAAELGMATVHHRGPRRRSPSSSGCWASNCGSEAPATARTKTTGPGASAPGPVEQNVVGIETLS